MFHISHMRLCTWSYYGQSPETQTSNTCLCFNTLNYNTDVMSFICFSSLKFYMWQSDISNLLNIRLLPVIIVLMSFKIGLSQVNQQWNLITVFQVRCFDLIFDKQSFIIKETYKAFFSLICSKQVMFWLIFDKQKKHTKLDINNVILSLFLYNYFQHKCKSYYFSRTKCVTPL